MKRVFAKLVGFDDGWGLNILVFDMTGKTVEQITTAGMGQDAKFTDMRYDKASLRLTFVIGGSIEEFPIYEITERDLEVMLRSDNWERLCSGLKNKSQKTWDWCVKRGIRS